MKKIFFSISVILIVLINVIAFNHAYKFSHFDMVYEEKAGKLEELNFFEKVKILFTGVRTTKPLNNKKPQLNYTSIKIENSRGYTLDTWFIQTQKSRGTVILFHGYRGNKSELIAGAKKFHRMGYNTLLVDFYGSGGSNGMETSIGYYEADDVIAAHDYLKNRGEKNIILYGASMGAVSILRALSIEKKLTPQAAIIECPYGTLLNTAKNRFDIMGMPSFPFAELLVFWGGVQNNYSGFSLDSKKFAQNVNIPVLLMHGKDDNRASMDEVKRIYENLQGQKELVLFDNTGHESYLEKVPYEWNKVVQTFLKKL